MSLGRRLAPFVAAGAVAFGVAAPAGAAVLSGVQTGTAVSTANGALNVTIAAINPAQSILFFDTSHDSDRPVGSSVRGTITNATTLTFTRVTDEASPAPPINIRWYVASFSSGVTVQRGEVNQTATVIDIGAPAFTGVAAVDHAFVTWSKTPQAADVNTMSDDDPVVGELTTTTNLQFRVVTAAAGMTISWQVVEFTNLPDVNVLKGSTSLTGGALSVDVTIPAVNVSSTFVLVGYTTSGIGADIGARLLRAQLINSTTIRIDRAIPGDADDIPEIAWQAVQLNDGSEVIRGSANLPTGVAQVVAGLNGRTIDLNGAVAFASVQPINGQSIGRSPYAGDDIAGVCSVTTTLTTPTSITLARDNTADVCDVGWFVVQWAPTLTTAVSLLSFTAQGGDGEVRLDWETGAELNNLGFNLYRSLSATGPWSRITASLVPGLGSSPDGARYAYRDVGLANGTAYFYLLEDVETTGRTRRHGPVAATPQAGAAALPPAGPAGSGPPASTPPSATPPDAAPPDSAPATAWLRYGDPEATSLRVVERDESHAVLELRTGGFYARPDSEDGGVWLSIPGFEETRAPGAPALPVKLAWLEAVAGRKVKVASVVSTDTVAFDGLRPAITGEPDVRTTAGGVVLARLRRRSADRSFRELGLYPQAAAELRGVAFQGDVKKAELELMPLRWDRTAGRLVLARRLRVHVLFAGQELEERSRGGSHGRGPRHGHKRRIEGVVARLTVREHGLYAVGFEQLFGDRSRSVSPSELRLSHLGETVAHHVEPQGRPFGPGSVLFFVSGDPSANPHGRELVYELSLAGGGLPMSVESAAPRGSAVPFAWSDRRFEEDRFYQPGLLLAQSPWLWDALVAPVTKTYPLDLSGSASGQPARLVVWLQGGSDFAADPDHHIRVSLNERVVGEASWDGQKPYRLEAEVPADLVVDGANRLEIENVGDTAAANSLVFLDWFELRVARQLAANAGVFEASFSQSGRAEIRGLAVGSQVLDTTEPAVRWLVDARPTSLGASWRVEAGRQFLAVSPSGVLRPDVRSARPARLSGTRVRADYMVVAPREFLAAAQPLLEQRQRQGLETLAVAVEDVYDEFGFGEPHPEAVKAFLEHAFQSWRRAPRYVLLLGDATYDFKDVLQTGVKNRVPPYIIQDAYLRTVSDPAYATVNGEDALPDFAIGRLPAQSLEQARSLVKKVLDWENAGFDLSGRAVLVSDNSDAAGDFEGDSEAVATTLLAGRPVERLYLSQLGAALRPGIAAAFDAGASLLSYLGHGGVAVWASENVWNDWDVPGLLPQPEQPFVLAMDCLNGYFHHPSMNALGEELVKAEGKGAIGAFAPSSLSVHWAAAIYHELLVRELTSGRHERLGDAILAAQAAYVEAGARPELLLSYQLLADPALRIRPRH